MREQELVEKIQAEDTTAFRELYDLYFDYAIRVATIVMNNAAHAADAVQETFIRVYRYSHLYEADRPFKPWFYKILLNECNRIMKKNANVISIGEGIEQQLTSERDNHKFEEYEDLYQAIQSLEPHQRTVIVLKYLNGFKEQEIAGILEGNVNTIKSRLFKGRQKLKRYLHTNSL